jgi:glutathione synthase
LVYYRAGYAPTDYPGGLDGVEWQARATLETSRATKCPSLGYHLAGTKKVQQTLARPGVLERFFPDEPDAVQAMRQAFAGLYSLGEDANELDLDVVSQILNKKGAAAMFVLKPQREGGGYNYYGDQLETKLRELTTTPEDGSSPPTLDPKLGEFILMERLFPPQQKAILLRAGKIEGSGDSISELGCCGTVVASAAGDVVHNEYAGFLLRTKFANVDEGGVASGFATLSSPYLCL